MRCRIYQTTLTNIENSDSVSESVKYSGQYTESDADCIFML
jgi:hypothetical protein